MKIKIHSENVQGIDQLLTICIDGVLVFRLKGNQSKLNPLEVRNDIKHFLKLLLNNIELWRNCRTPIEVEESSSIS